MNTLLILGFDTLLLLGYFLMHSGLASFKSKKCSQRFLPAHLYRLIYSFTTITYILLAAFFWKDSPLIIYQIPTCLLYVALSINLIGWGMYFYSHLMYYDVGGVFGSTQFFCKNGKINPPRLDISSNGLKRYIRFPVHTAFIPMFLTIPTMTASTLLFAVIATLYAWIGTYHHDSRYTTLLGDEYKAYKEKTGMVLPKLKGLRLQRYDESVPDAAPRKRSIPFILVLLTFLVPLGMGVFYGLSVHGLFNGSRIELFILPLIHALIMSLTTYLVSLKWNDFKITESKKANLQTMECAAFGAGVASAIVVGVYYLLDFLVNGMTMNFVMAIPCWVLGMIASNFAFYLATYKKPVSLLKRIYISIYGG